MGLAEVRDRRSQLLIAWALPAVLALLALLLAAAGEGAREALAYERAGVLAGEWWRLVSGHLVHLGWSHLWLNLAGLGLVWYLVGNRYTGVQWLIVAGTSLASMDAGFWFLDPWLDWYVGLSGLLHGLLAGGLVAALRERDREAAVIAAFVVAKLAWEQVAGPVPGSESTAGGAVIVDAHFFGAAGGLVGALAAGVTVRRPRPI